jgi:dihydrolipoamide dehydrogenase
MESIKTELVVLGAGPGGYAAAFYAADLGKKVILVEQEKNLGGVCLNRGCIPSKALLHATEMISEARESAHRGIVFESPKIDLDKMRAWKDSISATRGS